MQKELIRCPWCWTDPLYVRYHDEEWGKPVHDDQKLFEFLTLEWAQAGLSWITILRKRENYREHFHNWDIEKIANMREEELEQILLDPGIVRNRLKVYSVRKNARVALEIQREFGSLDQYFWSSEWFYPSHEKGRLGGVSQKGIPKSITPSHSPFSGGELQTFPIINHPHSMSDFVSESEISKMISKDLKKRGMTFVGSTIIYAFMQAVGMVDDHVVGCISKTK
jgi:DNA-3-methyladenine glycosylase I